MSKCSATLASEAAPPLGARQGSGGPKFLTIRDTLRWQCYTPPPLPRAKVSATGGSSQMGWVLGRGCS